MRVVASGNLTVELIRAQRFDVACQGHVDEAAERCRPYDHHANDEEHRIDRVLLSPQALASDPWAIDSKRVDAAVQQVTQAEQSAAPPREDDEPKQLSPVVGSPALGAVRRGSCLAHCWMSSPELSSGSCRLASNPPKLIRSC